MASCNYPEEEDDHHVLIEKKSHVRILTLNRPQQLNALTYKMVRCLTKNLIAYEEDSDVKLVIFKGKGKAFCAGGDVVNVSHLVNYGHWSLGAILFEHLYTFNYMTSTYKKPQVSILNGIVMGSGAGLSIHGRFRVATENTIFSMPEVKLGLFPDNGASYFLSRLPGFFGEYIGLTGARLDGAEMFACGLATHFVSSQRLPSLEEALLKVDISNCAVIRSILNRFSEEVILNEKSAYPRVDIIDRCFSKGTAEEILSALENEAVNETNEWITATIQSLREASPMSLKISLRSIREGRNQSLSECLIREYRMLCHALQGKISKDFYEGCRAILMVRDKIPKWKPSKLELVSEDMVDEYFLKVNDPQWKDLNLPIQFPSKSKL